MWVRQENVWVQHEKTYVGSTGRKSVQCEIKWVQYESIRGFDRKMCMGLTEFCAGRRVYIKLNMN